MWPVQFKVTLRIKTLDLYIVKYCTVCECLGMRLKRFQVILHPVWSKMKQALSLATMPAVVCVCVCVCVCVAVFTKYKKAADYSVSQEGQNIKPCPIFPHTEALQTEISIMFTVLVFFFCFFVFCPPDWLETWGGSITCECSSFRGSWGMFSGHGSRRRSTHFCSKGKCRVGLEPPPYSYDTDRCMMDLQRTVRKMCFISWSFWDWFVSAVNLCREFLSYMRHQTRLWTLNHLRLDCPTKTWSCNWGQVSPTETDQFNTF